MGVPVQLCLVTPEGGQEYVDVELARVPVAGDRIEHGGAEYVVDSVTFVTDGSAPFVLADKAS